MLFRGPRYQIQVLLDNERQRVRSEIRVREEEPMGDWEECNREERRFGHSDEILESTTGIVVDCN